MSKEWREHSLDDPAIDKPCSSSLEAFVGKMGWEMRPGGDCECSQDEIVRRVCSFYNLKPPITGEKIRTFLEEAGIYHDVAPNANDTTYIYNHMMSRWEIYSRPCKTYEWSREVWHEIWEILFWRCYHRIPWFKEWAARNKYHEPHNQADQFAFLMLLSPGSVSAQAKNRHYDLYKVADHYTVTTNHAFRAIQNYTKFPHPLIIAVLRLGVPPPTRTNADFTGDLFGGTVSQNTIHAKVYHKAYKPGTTVITPDQLQDIPSIQQRLDVERAFNMLSSHLREDNVLCIAADDPLLTYVQEEPKIWTLAHLFGIDLPTEVKVIVRQSSRSTQEIFIRIIPCGYEEAFLPKEPLWWDQQGLLKREMEKEWHNAAKAPKKRPEAHMPVS